jgi:hypothetical protein
MVCGVSCIVLFLTGPPPRCTGFAMRADPLVSSDLEQTIEECFQDMVAFTKRVMQLQ